MGSAKLKKLLEFRNEKMWARKTDSHKEAERFDLEYYLNMTPQKRVETMQYLRGIYYKEFEVN